MRIFAPLVLFLAICTIASAEQKYNPYTGQWDDDSNAQTVNLNVNRPLTWEEKQDMHKQQLVHSVEQLSQSIFGQPNQERELYTKTFGEPITIQNKQKPLTNLEMQRLQYYFQTKRDLWRKESN